MGRTVAWLRAQALRWQGVPPWLRALPPLVWMAWLWWLSAQEHLPELGGPVGGLAHNAAHLPAYAVLGALLYLLLPEALRGRTAIAIAIAALYGAIDEIHQGFVPHRVSDPYDVASDTMGAAVACCWCAWQLAGDARCRRALPWLCLGAAAAVVMSTWHPL